ncbi:MAG TPA: DoxX family protein [Campylobacterales bacterium]|nr:DoxX family protein [Campylobacterales bacterium]
MVDLDWTFRVLTIGLGVLILFNGVHKILNGVDFITPLLEAYSIPYAEYLAYGVYIGEVIAPFLLISGYYIRVAGGVIVLNMLVAIFLVHQNEIFTLTEHGSWSLEIPMLYLVIGLALLLSKEPHR